MGRLALRLAAAERPTRLSALLTHLYVLLPVLDDEKHYWVDESEVEKLLRRGADWLPAHPERELITRRYLKHERRLYNPVLAEFADDSPAPEREEALEERVSLRDQRLGTVQAVLKASGARRVLDLGCGPGALLERLVRDGYEQVTGVDVSPRVLDMAARRLKLERRPKPRVALWQSPLTYRDRRFAGYDAAALVEVIEHFDPPRLAALEANVFGSAVPGCVVVTTPNAEYNRCGSRCRRASSVTPTTASSGRVRSSGVWASDVAARFGYGVRFLPVGPEDAVVGPPTQLAVFER